MIVLILIQLLNLSEHTESISTLQFSNNISSGFINSPSFTFSFKDRSIIVDTKLRLNDKERYEIEVNPTSIKAERAGDYAKIQEFFFKPHEYTWSREFSLEFEYKLNKMFSIASTGEFIKETFTKNIPEYVVSKDENLVPFSVLTETKRELGVGSSKLITSLGNADVALGFSHLTIFKSGDGVEYISPKKSLELELNYNIVNSYVSFLVNDYAKTYRFSQTFRSPLNNRKSNIFIDIKTSEILSAKKIHFGLSHTVNESIILNLGVQSQTYRTGIDSEKLFTDWKKIALDFPKIDNSIIDVGFSYVFNSFSDLRLVRVNKSQINSQEYLISEHVETYEKLIGFIELQNISEIKLSGQITTESIDQVISHKSNLYEIPVNGKIRLPIIIRISDNLQDNSLKQVSVKFNFNQNEISLLNIPISVYKQSVWKGEIKSLVSYISTTNSQLRKNISTIEYQLNKQNITNTFLQLKEAIRWFGKFEVKYKRDDVENFGYDNVQSLNETLTRKAGDCEDLAVLYASYLSGLGIEAKFIDFNRSKTSEINHVFLLINTELLPSEMIENGLNQLNSYVFQNRFGKPTLWIAVEVNEIQNGFIAAHKSGSKQLYRSTIINNEPINYISLRTQ